MFFPASHELPSSSFLIFVPPVLADQFVRGHPRRQFLRIWPIPTHSQQTIRSVLPYPIRWRRYSYGHSDPIYVHGLLRYDRLHRPFSTVGRLLQFRSGSFFVSGGPHTMPICKPSVVPSFRCWGLALPVPSGRRLLGPVGRSGCCISCFRIEGHIEGLAFFLSVRSS
jgi:hypothetical protein